MHVSGHKTQKTFMDYIKLSSDEIADYIDAIYHPTKADIFFISSQMMAKMQPATYEYKTGLILNYTTQPFIV